MKDAVSACAAMGMRIAEPKTKRQSDLMAQTSIHDKWVPATDEDSEGTFKWLDGSLLEWSYWSGDEPNNWGNQEDCVVSGNNGKWNDISCSSNYGYVCITDQLVPPICADFTDTCRKLFIADPSVCRTHTQWAKRICPLTCGHCDSDKATCVPPPSPANSMLLTNQSSLMNIGDYVQHRCNPGYMTKSGDELGRGCLPDGTLSGQALECMESCPQRRRDGWYWDQTSQKCYGYFDTPSNFLDATSACTKIGMSVT